MASLGCFNMNGDGRGRGQGGGGCDNVTCVKQWLNKAKIWLRKRGNGALGPALNLV